MNWKKKTAYGVLLFLIVLFYWISQEAKAETILEVSPVIAYAGTPEPGQYALMAHERFKGKYDVGLILLLDGKGNDDNRGFDILRTTHHNNWEAGIGWAHWANEQSKAWNTRDAFTLVLGYERGNWGIRWRHFSTAGTSSKNSGLDMLTVGYAFR